MKNKSTKKIMKPVNVIATSFVLTSALLSTGSEVVASSTDVSKPLVKPANEIVSKTILVATFSELKSAIESDNGSEQINLKNDIVLTDTVIIPENKKNLKINGNGFKLVVNHSNNNYFPFLVNKSNLNNANLLIENLTYVGKDSNMGMVVVEDIVKNYTITHRNLKFNGNQLIFNRYGTTILKDWTTVTIPSTSSRPLGQVGNVVLDGKISINHSGDYDNVFIVEKLPNSFMTVTSNSTITINTHTTEGAIYHTTEANEGSLKIEDKANMTTRGTKGLTTVSPLKEVYVGKNAQLNGDKTFKDGYQYLSISEKLTFDEESTGWLSNSGMGSAISFVGNEMTTSQFVLNNPKNVILRAANGKSIVNNPNKKLNMMVKAKSVNYWYSTTNLTSFDKVNTTNWTLKTGDIIDVTQQLIGNEEISQTGNINTPLPKDFSQNTVLMSFGEKTQLSMEDIKSGSNVVKGTATPESQILIKHSISDGTKKTYQTKASVDGVYSLTLANPATSKDKFDVLAVKYNRTAELHDIEVIHSDFDATVNSVDILFTDNKYNQLAPPTNQFALDDTRAKVESLPEGTEKENLMKKVDLAQQLLDAQNKVDGLVDGSGVIKPGTDQKAVDDARAVVGKLPEGPQKEELGKKLDDIQKQLDDKKTAEAEQVATESVEDLFTDEGLAPGVDQKAIDDARGQIKALPEGKVKEDLMKKADLAQQLLDAQNKVNGLVDGSGVIKPGTDQKAVDDARAVVGKLPEGPQKEELGKKLGDIQKQLDNKDLDNIKVNTLEEVTTTDIYIRGVVSETTERVKIFLQCNGESEPMMVRWRPVKENGSFYGHVSNTLQVGDRIIVVPIDAKGREGEASEIIVKTSNLVDPPKLDIYAEGASVITGQSAKGTSYVMISVKTATGQEFTRKRNVESDGSFYGSLYFDGKAVAEVGDIVTVTPYDAQNNKGTPATTIVQTRPVAIDAFVETDMTIKGQTTKMADKVDIYVNDKFLRTRTVEADGSFFGSMLVNGKTVAKAGDVITVKVRTDQGRILATGTTKVIAAEVANAPEVDVYLAGNKELTGTADANVKRMRVYLPDGKAVNRGTIANGGFRIHVQDFNLKAGDKVKVVGILESGRETPAAEITVR